MGFLLSRDKVCGKAGKRLGNWISAKTMLSFESSNGETKKAIELISVPKSVQIYAGCFDVHSVIIE